MTVITPDTVMILVVVSCAVGAGVSAYITTKVLAFKTRKKRRSRENALNEIANHKWDTGDHNDAVVVTRIALRGLNGE